MEHNIKYSLIGIISSPSSIHFAAFIINYEDNIPNYNLKLGCTYLHDCCNNNGSFVEFDDI